MECLNAVLARFIESICGTIAEAGDEVPQLPLTGAQLPRLPQLNSSVFQFYTPPGDTSCNVEIVFFHGLEPGDYGNAYAETWISELVDCTSCYWPQKFLAENFPQARILSVSYDSSIRKGKRQGRLDLFLTAENLLQDLKDGSGRVGTKDGRPVVLVGKGFGRSRH